jgi:hypothetical protein
MLLPVTLKKKSLALLLILIMEVFILSFSMFGQSTTIIDTTDKSHVIVIAGKQYEAGKFHQWLFGHHYRKEWTAPVKVKTVYLDTLAGGLTPYQQGGGRQSKTLRLWDSDKKEYVLRSIDKTFGGALPEIYQRTFIEKIVNDQVSIAHPYAALTIPQMAEAAKIDHTNPEIFLIPKQKRLGKYNDEYGNQLFLFEQRPDENWEDAENFSNSENIIGTDKLLKKMMEENDHRPNQTAFIRARLFDMFIGDWGRHEDQWRWATIDKADGKSYNPIPRDRDQVYTKFDGILLNTLISAANIGHLQTFDYNIKDVALYNFPARHLDRQMANETTLQQWVSTAKELQTLLTDGVIESSVKEMPPEVFPFSGTEIIAKLKSRRDHLVAFATDYYKSLAKEVDIIGSEKEELFEITILNDLATKIEAFDLDKNDLPKNKSFYSRVFEAAETKEVRIYGLDGHDRYTIKGNAKNNISIRLIGGLAEDDYKDSTTVEIKKIQVYDNRDNHFPSSKNINRHLSKNPFIHQFQYDAFEYDKKGIKPALFYNSEDHIFIGIGYEFVKQQWRKLPYGYKQSVHVNYSVTEKAFSGGYDGIFTDVFGKWGLGLGFNYDDMRWINYFGLGNESILTTKIRDYNRMRTQQIDASIGINRLFAFYNKINIATFYNAVKILDDPDRFLATHPPATNKALYQWKHFGGIRLDYNFTKLNNPVLPQKGIEFNTDLTYTINLKQSDSNFTRLASSVNFYFPLSNSFVLRVRTGAATLSGDPEFYQLNLLGGGQTLRGYRKYRFYGKTMAFNQNELQFIRNVKTFLFNGKAGLLGLFDIGRVWQPGENSSSWHTGYGGGIILSPFNKLSVYVTYAVSKEDGDFGLRFYKSL